MRCPSAPPLTFSLYRPSAASLPKLLILTLPTAPFYLSRFILAMLTCASGSSPKTYPSLHLSFCYTPETLNPLLGFLIFLPMGCVDSEQLFCCMTKTITRIVNSFLSSTPAAHPHPLNYVSNTHPTPDNNVTAIWPDCNLYCNLATLCRNLLEASDPRLLHYFNVYMDNFCALIKRSIGINTQVCRHLFHFIYLVLLPTKEAEIVWKDSNIIKDLHRGDSTWTMQMKMLVWIVVFFRHVISLLTSRH